MLSYSENPLCRVPSDRLARRESLLAFAVRFLAPPVVGRLVVPFKILLQYLLYRSPEIVQLTVDQ